jgi:hypothetical protein
MQRCSEAGCERTAAFKTRSRPTWCDEHLTAMLAAGGLEPLEPFVKPTVFRLTRCLNCGCEAHYRLEYVLDRNRAGELTCRACFWRDWARQTRAVQHLPYAAVDLAEARSHVEANGFDYIEALTSPSLHDDPHRVRCRRCRRISATRLSDVSFGCTCESNPRRDRQTNNVSEPRCKELLKDSGLPALDWWDHESNDPVEWNTATVTAWREVHWRCPACDLRFARRTTEMASWPECPACEEKRRAAWQAEYERYQTTPVADVPQLASDWDDEADPRQVMVAGDHQLRRFRCAQGHHPRIAPHTYLQSGCPSCRGAQTRKKRLEEVAADPTVAAMNPEIAAQWHPDKNGSTQLASVSPESRRTFWWRDPGCGHEWQSTPRDRQKGRRLRCPQCRTILDSLAYHFPELAAEWSVANPITAWQIRPTGQTSFDPLWKCSKDPNHEWAAQLSSRAVGSGCPECREAGKSRVELLHHAEAERVFGRAASGRAIRSEAFSRRSRWLVDITVVLRDGRQLAIEYDGAYWHADKTDLDTEKSRDLLAAGYLVVRLREYPLPPLPILDDRYAEFSVHPVVPNPAGIMDAVRAWTSGASQ